MTFFQMPRKQRAMSGSATARIHMENTNIRLRSGSAGHRPLSGDEDDESDHEEPIHVSLNWEVVLIANFRFLLQWKPLNVIAFGQSQSDSNNRLIIIKEWVSMYFRFERVIWDLSSWIKLIPLTDWSYYPWYP